MTNLGNRNSIIRAALFLILIYLFYLYISVGISPIDISLMKKVLLLSMLGWLFYIYKEEPISTLKNQYLTVSVIFLIGFLPTCFQYYFMYVFDIVPDLSLGYYLNTNVVNKSIILSSIGVISYFIGNLHRMKSYVIVNDTNKQPPIRLNSKKIQMCSVIFFIIYFLAMPKEYFRGNYGNQDLGASVPFFADFAQQFFVYFVISSIAIESYKIRKECVKVSVINYCKKFNVIFLITLFLYTVLILMSGDRDHIIYTTGLFIIAYFISNRIQLGLKKVVLFGVPIVLVMFVMGLLRNVDFNASTQEKVEAAVEISDNMNIAVGFAVTNEFALVVRAQHAIIMHVEHYGHQFLTLLYEFAGLIPGMGMVFTTVLGVTQDDIGSTRIATAEMGSDHGMGTTCIGDLYLSLGVIGVALFMFFLGYLFRLLESNIYRNTETIGHWVFYITLLGFAVLIGRADMMTAFRQCFYVYIITFLFNTSSFMSKKKGSNCYVV